MVSFGGVGSTIGGAMLSWVFWLLLAIVLIFVVFGSLYFRKKGKFIFPAIIYTDLGNGRVNIINVRAGWFKSKKFFGGLLDVAGERRLETNDGRIIQQGSSSDLQEIEFQAGLFLMEKPDDPKVLIPIRKIYLAPESRKMMMEISPADYRDASSKIIADAEKESLSRWETIAQILVFGLLAVVLFVSIILVIQYSKNTMADANAIHKEALTFYQQVLNRMSAVPSEVISNSTAP